MGGPTVCTRPARPPALAAATVPGAAPQLNTRPHPAGGPCPCSSRPLHVLLLLSCPRTLLLQLLIEIVDVDRLAGGDVPHGAARGPWWAAFRPVELSGVVWRAQAPLRRQAINDGGRAADGLRACPRRSFQESESSAGGEGKRRSLREKNGREARRDLAVRPKGALRPPSPSFPGGLCVGTACPPCQAGKHHGYAYQQEEEGAASRGAHRLPDGLGMPACGPDAPGDPAWEAHAGSACHWAALQGAGKRGLALCAAGWRAGSALAIPCSTGCPPGGAARRGGRVGAAVRSGEGHPFQHRNNTEPPVCCARRPAVCGGRRVLRRAE